MCVCLSLSLFWLLLIGPRVVGVMASITHFAIFLSGGFSPFEFYYYYIIFFFLLRSPFKSSQLPAVGKNTMWCSFGVERSTILPSIPASGTAARDVVYPTQTVHFEAIRARSGISNCFRREQTKGRRRPIGMTALVVCWPARLILFS